MSDVTAQLKEIDDELAHLTGPDPAREFRAQSPDGNSPGETIFVKAYIRKAHDQSNHVVDCAGETFNPAAQALADAEPGIADIPALESLVSYLKNKKATAIAKARRIDSLQQRRAELAPQVEDQQTAGGESGQGGGATQVGGAPKG